MLHTAQASLQTGLSLLKTPSDLSVTPDADPSVLLDLERHMIPAWDFVILHLNFFLPKIAGQVGYLMQEEQLREGSSWAGISSASYKLHLLSNPRCSACAVELAIFEDFSKSIVEA